jgi:probable H4MPT-linked C1 transfer pathway protein
MQCIVGWDIGAANVKVAWVAPSQSGARQIRVASRPFEIWREKDRLPEVLQGVWTSVVSGESPQALAITMTAELSDVFSTKREGVLFVLENLKSCFPGTASYVFSLSGEFVSLNEALTRPLEFVATNWLASARWVAGQFPNCLLLDVGSTTTDILPILNGEVCVSGRTDTERLSYGELVYTGLLRTNLAAIVQSVPVSGRLCRVASEYFAISGDVHLLLGHLQPEDYTCTTPDGRPPSVESARNRIARLVCGDIETLSTNEIDELARYVYAQQILQIREAMNQVISRLPCLRRHPVIVFGAGALLGVAAAGALGLKIQDLSNDWGKEAIAVSPCLAVAHLLLDQQNADLP